MPEIIFGVVLSEMFYREAVKPLLNSDFPRLSYSAALIGNGSEVLGYDSEISRDHDWGPRLMLFLRDSDCPRYQEQISLALQKPGLPE